MYVCYSAALTSACIFMTASSTNVASTQFAKDLWGIDISRMLWFAAASVPGLPITVITPPVLRFLIKPELNAIPEIRREAAEKSKHSDLCLIPKKLCASFCHCFAAVVHLGFARN